MPLWMKLRNAESAVARNPRDKKAAERLSKLKKQYDPDNVFGQWFSLA